MKLKLTAIAVAAMLASGASWADMKAAEKWVDKEFQPSTLSKKQQLDEMKWFIDAAAKLAEQKANLQKNWGDKFAYNHLQAIVGFADLLIGNYRASDPRYQDVMQIKNSANRAKSLVRQLLAFSRRQTLQPRLVDLSEFLKGGDKLLRPHLGEGVSLEINPESQAAVVRDPDRGRRDAECLGGGGDEERRSRLPPPSTA